MTLLPNCVTGVSRSAPPKLPMAVLTPSTMTISSIFNVFALVTRASIWVMVGLFLRLFVMWAQPTLLPVGFVRWCSV